MSVKLPSGAGTALLTIAYVKDAFNDPENEEIIKDLYSAMFSEKAPGPREIKERISSFNGFPKGSEFQTDLEANLQKDSLTQLKAMCKLLALHMTGAKGALVTSIVEFLQNPTDPQKTYHAKKNKEKDGKETKSSHKTGSMSLTAGEEEEEDEEDEEEENNADGQPKEKATRRKRSGKPKDPNEPKRPLTAYFLFLKEEQPKVMQELQEKEGQKPALIAVTKVVGERWKALPEEEKAPYNKQAEELKQQYLKEMDEYRKSGKKEAWEKEHANDDHSGSRKKETDPNAPKKPLSAYLRFQAEYRAKVVEEATQGDVKPTPKVIMSMLADKWKQISPEEKERFEKMAKEDQERYAKEMEEYKSSGKEEAFKQQQREKEKEKKETKKEKPFKFRRGQEPSRKEMEIWIKQYLEKDPEKDTISLKTIRKTMEEECGVSLSSKKTDIEQIVTKLANSN